MLYLPLTRDLANRLYRFLDPEVRPGMGRIHEALGGVLRSRVQYDASMDLAYTVGEGIDGEDGKAIEVTVVVMDPLDHTHRNELTYDNLTNAMWLLVLNDLKPVNEYLAIREAMTVQGGEKEVPGLEGTALDGVTPQAILDGYRAQQGPFRVVIEVEGDPSILEAVNELEKARVQQVFDKLAAEDDLGITEAKNRPDAHCGHCGCSEPHLRTPHASNCPMVV